MSKSKGIFLPNTHKLWEKGFSISLYSRSYDQYTKTHDFTKLGKTIYEYKYHKDLTELRRKELVEIWFKEISNVLNLEVEKEKQTFNSCIGVMPNRNLGHSLPLDLAFQLAKNFDWLRDDSKCIQKVKELPIMKNLSLEERREALKGAYKVDTNYSFRGIRGFLIIDDVYESGSTLREMCRTLGRVVPEIPRYVVSLTHLRKVWDSPR